MDVSFISVLQVAVRWNIIFFQDRRVPAHRFVAVEDQRSAHAHELNLAEPV